MKQGRWLGRAARGVRPDRNPLRRRSDRVEAFIFGGLVVAAAAGAPVAATMAGNWAYADTARAAQLQQETRHPAWATLVAPPQATVSGYTISGMTPALARWTTPSGALRTGQVSVPSGSAKGTAVAIWIDQAGDVTTPPLTPAQVDDQGTLMAFVTAAATLMACLVAALATRFVVNRRRMAAWTADWAVTAPKWARQRW
jgi:hypothetical protein